MKLLAAATALLMSAAPAMASHKHHYHHVPKDRISYYDNWNTCERKEVHSYYYMGDWHERVNYSRIPGCKTHHHHHHHHGSVPDTPKTVIQKNARRKTDDNSCIEGSILGGIAGGGIAAGLSKSDAMPWSIPLGVVSGVLIGCQVDGG